LRVLLYKRAEKAEAGNQTARMVADEGILAASMGIGCYLPFDRYFMSETSFLISERVFGGAIGALDGKLPTLSLFTPLAFIDL
jgi:hypothetical protein